MIFVFQINRPHIYFLPHVFVIIVIIIRCACMNFVDLRPRKVASSSSERITGRFKEEARLELVIAAVIVVFTLMRSSTLPIIELIIETVSV